MELPRLLLSEQCVAQFAFFLIPARNLACGSFFRRSYSALMVSTNWLMLTAPGRRLSPSLNTM